MNKIWVVALSLGIAPLAQALQPAPLMTGVAAVEEGRYLPGEFVITFRPEAKADPRRSDKGVVVTGLDQVDRLNARFGVYAAIPGSEAGTFRFKVPTGANIREIVAAYRGLSEPVKTADGVLAGSLDGRQTADAALVAPKQKLTGVLLAANAGVTNPDALFEGQAQVNGLVHTLALRQEGSVDQRGMIQRVACNPDIEECSAPVTPPARRNCNPDIESCGTSRPTQPTRPTTPQRRPGEVTCTPGVDPGCGGAPVDTRPPEPTRPPMNWTTNPYRPPSNWSQPGSSIQFLRSTPGGWWRPVGSAWFPVTFTTGYGNFGTDSATIERGGQDTGKGQRSEYTKTFRTTSSADRYQLYYSRVGVNCQVYQGDTYCQDWGTEYRWIWAGSDTRAREATIDVKFNNDKPLLPWETESFTFSYNGDAQQVSSQIGGNSWSYDYRATGPTQNFATGRAEFVITAGAKRQTAADNNAVSAGLELRNGKVWLVVHDKRAMFYKGEPLDVSIKVLRTWSCKNGSFWHDLGCSDPVATVFESKTNDQPNPRLRIGIPANLSLPANQAFAGPESMPAGCNPDIEACQKVVGVNVDQGNGKYYIETGWSSAGQFRRVGSALSTSDWHNNVTIERKEVTR